MKITTQATKKLIPVFVVLVLASSLMLVKGCGSSSSSGGCSENAALQGFTITALNPGLGAPSVALGANCYQPVNFIVKDSTGGVVNGICVEIHTGTLAAPNTQVAAHTPGSFNCANANASNATDMTMTSDDSGVVSLEFRVTPTAMGQVFFIDVASGAAAPAELKTAASTT